jgi:hypothetical protein
MDLEEMRKPAESKMEGQAMLPLKALIRQMRMIIIII